ncbi:MAG: HAD-IIB family hydrolase [Candidatus Sulfobium sp.]|jgi:mannosyl-3-phosphoglycerate phosphatase family protein
MKKLVIFTDLDGTLLDDSTYSFDAALPALRIIRQENVPLVICSSKTRGEIEFYRRMLGNTHPFVSENGGGVFVPKGYFSTTPDRISAPDGADTRISIEETGDYYTIRLGTPYGELRRAVEVLRKKGLDIRGFGDMTTEEISLLTGLCAEETLMSRERDFDEPFVFKGDEQALAAAIREMGLNCTRGKFFHIVGDNDKGKAVAILAGLYKQEYGEVYTAALGDNPNDLPMLLSADYPVIVQKPGGCYEPQIDLPGMIRAGGIGPEGWNREVLKLLGRRG